MDSVPPSTPITTSIVGGEVMCDDDVFAWHGLLLLSNTNRKKSNRLLITVMSAGYIIWLWDGYGYVWALSLDC
jgi:hypothetical protein